MSITLTGLLAEVRSRLDETTARFWTDAELTRWINEGMKQIAVRSETLAVRNTSLAAVAGTARYTLPADVSRMHKVEFVPTGQTQIYPVKAATRDEMEPVWGLNQAQVGSYPSFYVLWGFAPAIEMQVFPVPSGGGVFNLYYYKVPAALVNGSDIALIPDGWEGIIADFCEYRAKRKDRDPDWQSAKQEFENNLENMSEMLRQLHDQQQYITNSNGVGVPAWLYSPDYDF